MVFFSLFEHSEMVRFLLGVVLIKLKLNESYNARMKNMKHRNRLGAHFCRRGLLEETVFQIITRRLCGNTKLSFLTPHPVKPELILEQHGFRMPILHAVKNAQ